MKLPSRQKERVREGRQAETPTAAEGKGAQRKKENCSGNNRAKAK